MPVMLPAFSSQLVQSNFERSMLGSSLSSLCNRRCSWITRASRARRYVLSSVIYALQPLPIRKPFEGCMVGGCQSHISPKVRSCSR